MIVVDVRPFTDRRDVGIMGTFEPECRHEFVVERLDCRQRGYARIDVVEAQELWHGGSITEPKSRLIRRSRELIWAPARLLSEVKNHDEPEGLS